MSRVGLVFGGRSVEHRVSVVSARTVARGLRAAGHEVVPLGIAEDGAWLAPEAGARALAGDLDALPAPGGPVAPSLRHLLEARVDIVFPIAHGTWGEDGTLQGLLEMADLPYVGAGVTASAVAMDKLLAKRLFEAAGLPVVEYRGVSGRELATHREAVLASCHALAPILFVKPAVGGSSVGVQRVGEGEVLGEALDTALRFGDPVLVERAVEGREIECSVLGMGALEASGLGEIVPGAAFYDYADKYLTDAARLLVPADLPAELAERMRRLAVEAFAVLGGWGMARVDFLLEGSEPYVSEVNTLPGFTAISMYPRLWEVAGVPLPELVDRLIRIAIDRHTERASLDATIKKFLAELGLA